MHGDLGGVVVDEMADTVVREAAQASPFTQGANGRLVIFGEDAAGAQTDDVGEGRCQAGRGNGSWVHALNTGCQLTRNGRAEADGHKKARTGEGAGGRGRRRKSTRCYWMLLWGQLAGGKVFRNRYAPPFDATRLHATLRALGCGTEGAKRTHVSVFSRFGGVYKSGQDWRPGEKRHMCRFWAGTRRVVRDESENKYVTVTDLMVGGSERGMGQDWWGRNPKVVSSERFPVWAG